MCCYVRRGFRRQGIAGALLQAAVAHTTTQGAAALYGLPDRGSATKPGSRGSVAMFKTAGFVAVTSLSTYFTPMRRDLGSAGLSI